MKNSWMAGVFAAGLAVVGWVAWGFVGISPLALAMTAVIAAVYVLGAYELAQFRSASRSLRLALTALPDSASGLETWSRGLHASVRAAVLRRIDGEPAALPGPALTPYLVGLLVMLGMLGTFLGMVVTFNGAVVALEASTQLESIRSALAAPIKGLGLSFGTSVAGVAASAMLGLMSALARRERLAVVRALDGHIARELRAFSGARRRDAMLEAMQAQADALPLIAQRLETLANGIERRHQELDAQLVARTDAFHREASGAYAALASAVGGSLQSSLKAAATAAGDTVRPIVERAMRTLTEQADLSHARLDAATQDHLRVLGAQWDAATRDVSATWTGALRAHEQTQSVMLARMDEALKAVTQSLAQRSDALLSAVHDLTAQAARAQAVAEEERLARWADALTGLTGRLAVQWEEAGAQAAQQQRDVAQALQGAALQLDASLKSTAQGFDQRTATMLQTLHEAAERSQQRQAEAERERMAQWTESMARMSAALVDQWQGAATETMRQQQAVAQALADTADRVSQRVDQQLDHTLGAAARLLGQSEALVQARMQAEQGWLEAQGHRMDSLAALWRDELAALRDQEAQRGQAAVDRLDALQAAVAVHLQNLGAALEAPLTRLLHTASEVPQAAAGVITQLREEMSRLSERDTQALAERTAMTGQLGQLLDTVGQAADRQGAAIQTMVASAAQVLEEATARFAAVLEAQSAKADDAAAHVAASAVELSSLGEAFAHGVSLFTESNERLMQGLGRIESALGQSLTRSDEQLAYYVAQAREVIDLSITSQQAIVEDLRRQQALQPRTTAVAEAA